MGKRKASEGLEAEELGMQLTPMIDVIFQLLIFFMVNIKFRTLEGLLKAYLPARSANPENQPKKKYPPFYINLTVPGDDLNDVELDLNGTEVLSGTTIPERFDSLLQKMEEFRETYPSKKDRPDVILYAQDDVQYRYVVQALNVCGKAKVEDVTFGTPPDGS